MRRVWTITELLSELMGILDQKDLVRMLCVCQVLWGVAMPIVWRSIILLRLRSIYNMNDLEIKFKVAGARVLRYFPLSLLRLI